jgi:anti-sigma B factor antagonist
MASQPAIISGGGLNLRTFREEDIAVVGCSGRLVAESCGCLKDHVRSMIRREKRIALDLAEVTRLDSAGLGTLVALFISAKHANCELRLCNLSKPVQDLVGLSNLLSVLEICGKSGARFF